MENINWVDASTARDMTEMEKIVVDCVCGAAKLCHLSKNGLDDIKITRKSDKEYDLKLEGPGFSAWLPLLCIKEMTCWPSHEIASLTDYPSMAERGDWSGVRDTDPERIMAIFKKFVVKPMEKLFGKGA